MGPVLDIFNPQLSATKKAKQKDVSKVYSLQGFNGCHYVVFIELIHFFWGRKCWKVGHKSHLHNQKEVS